MTRCDLGNYAPCVGTDYRRLEVKACVWRASGLHVPAWGLRCST